MTGTRIRRTAMLRCGLVLTILAALFSFEASAAVASDHLPRSKPEEGGIAAERLPRVNDVVRRHIHSRHIAGAVTPVARKGRVVWESSPVTERTQRALLLA